MDPEPLTLRELLAMSEGADRSRWLHTSALLALIYNVNRDSKKTAAKQPRHFDPYHRGRVKKLSVREAYEMMTTGRVTAPKAGPRKKDRRKERTR